MSKDVGHWIGGRRAAGTSCRYGDIFNPSVGEKSGRVAFASAAEVDTAVQAAREALPKWAAVTARYDERQVSALLLQIGTLNLFNRLNVAVKEQADHPSWKQG